VSYSACCSVRGIICCSMCCSVCCSVCVVVVCVAPFLEPLPLLSSSLHEREGDCVGSWV